MKKRFRKLLSDKCKDMGLTDKALDSLTELGVEGIDDDASDEDVAKKVDSIVPYAKAMQAEITRKTRTPKSQSKQSQSNGEGDGEGDNNGDGDEMPTWARSLKSEMQALRKENDDLKAERAKADRQAQIAAKAKSLGIPDYLLKRMAFADDADIDKELEAFKQDLVTNNLMPKGQTHETGTEIEQMKAAAKSWAETLPDNK